MQSQCFDLLIYGKSVILDPDLPKLSAEVNQHLNIILCKLSLHAICRVDMILFDDLSDIGHGKSKHVVT